MEGDFGLEFYKQIITWISNNVPVDEVYQERELDYWALANGYIKEPVDERPAEDRYVPRDY